MPDRLIAHATRKQQLAEIGLDVTGIAQRVRDAIHAVQNLPADAQAVEVSVRAPKNRKAMANQEG